VTQESCFLLSNKLKEVDSLLVKMKTATDVLASLSTGPNPSPSPSPFPSLPLLPPIHVHIQSYGGDLMPMLHVLDCIDSLSCPVWTYVDGYAWSAASLLSVYGERRLMTRRSSVLIHELRGKMEGTYSDMVSASEHTRMLMDEIRSIYLSKTRMEEEELDILLKQDAWLSSEDCLRLGIVDEVV